MTIDAIVLGKRVKFQYAKQSGITERVGVLVPNSKSTPEGGTHITIQPDEGGDPKTFRTAQITSFSYVL
jgi:hypothetical protein